MRVRLLLSCLFLLCGAPRVWADGSTALGPLPTEVERAFRSLRPDPPPERLAMDAHFIVSDERAQHVFHHHVEGLGGLFVGVGTDQNYLMAAWARSEIVVMLDFDQVVVDLHGVYRALFLAAETPAEFLRLWGAEARDDAEAAIAAAEQDPARVRLLQRLWRRTQVRVARRLAALRTIQRGAGIDWFLTDPAQYAWLRGLHQADRVFAVRGDLTKDVALRDVAAAAKVAGVPLRVLYLSNAERYFRYNEEFTGNVLALPFDERSVVLRTGSESTLGGEKADHHYMYYVQRGLDFRAWFDGRRPPRNIYTVLYRNEPDPRWPGLYIGGPPPPPRGR
jgi:hypothetical protein